MRYLLKFLGHPSIKKISLELSIWQNNLRSHIEIGKKIVGTLQGQYTADSSRSYNAADELQRRAVQAFQVRFAANAIKALKSPVVVDIGDSSGAHLLQIREICPNIADTYSVNIDEKAVERIRKIGLKAIHARAEDLVNLGIRGNVLLSFEMVEHLHDPANFLRSLSYRTDCDYFIMTVPYVRVSRVGLKPIRQKRAIPMNAETLHVFELCPEDWKLLALHAGFEAAHEEIYHQFPVGLPVTPIWRLFWKTYGYEGFWAVLFKKNHTYSDMYSDWPEYR